MTLDEADAEAKRRWGPKAKAQLYHQEGYFEIVLDVAERIGWDVKKWGPLTQVLGFSTSWEEAIENAIGGQFSAGS